MITGVLSASQASEALGISRRQFYRWLPELRRLRIVVEAEPRIGHPRYLPGPIAAYVNGETRRTVLREVLGKVG